jgi:5-methyltetrahydropteroyltriglutamate--homocysteine methyltransferase
MSGQLKRTTPPFRADHVGSLLRPPALKAAREAHNAGRITSEQLREAEDAAVREVVKLQEDVGLKGVSDGEVRRGSWHMAQGDGKTEAHPDDLR